MSHAEHNWLSHPYVEVVNSDWCSRCGMMRMGTTADPDGVCCEDYYIVGSAEPERRRRVRHDEDKGSMKLGFPDDPPCVGTVAGQP